MPQNICSFGQSSTLLFFGNSSSDHVRIKTYGFLDHGAYHHRQDHEYHCYFHVAILRCQCSHYQYLHHSAVAIFILRH